MASRPPVADNAIESEVDVPAGPCPHIEAIDEVKHPKKRVCEECIRHGGSWLHLRTCQTCGMTLCCDSSPARHASAHARAAKHPVIASAEPGERWLFCYPDDAFVEY
jgi:Zn-finger in ubiquitin-hydrolases and other protein